jgi:hypothetical protein
MADRTTATTDFNLDLNTIVEEAFERCGAELRTGYDLRTAKRSLSLLLMDWANRGINLWTLETGTQVLTAGTGTYDLPADTVDLLDHVIRTGTGQNQIDINISRISSSTYVAVPNKNATGRPIQIWIDRRTGATDSTGAVVYPQFTVWPLPDSSTTYTLFYTRLRRMFDVGNGANGQDVPFRFLPCLVAGLSYMLSMKIPGAADRVQILKAQYDEAWDLAAGEDREKAPVRFVPRQGFVGGY